MKHLEAPKNRYGNLLDIEIRISSDVLGWGHKAPLVLARMTHNQYKRGTIS
jgi:hypothetical protein